MHIVLLRFYEHPTPVDDCIGAGLRALDHTVWLGSLAETGDFEWVDERGVFAALPGPMRLPERWVNKHLVAAVLRRIVFLDFLVRLRKFLRAHKPAVVQVNPACMYWVWLLPLFMPRQMSFALDFQQIGQRSDTGLISRFKNWLGNVESRMWSQFIYDRALFMHPAGAKKILGEHWERWGSVVPLGVPATFLSFEHKPEQPSDEKRPVRFIYIGTISRIRQLERLFYATQRMTAVTNGFQVTFMGVDAEQGYYHQLVEQLGLSTVITINPPVPHQDVPTVLAENDVALAYVPEYPPDWQYAPTIKVCEYRALGLPIIATDFEPNRELVIEGVNGLLVDNDEEAWAQAMLAFVTDRDLLNHCRMEARNMRQGRLWRDVARMYEEVYVDICAGGHPGSGTG